MASDVAFSMSSTVSLESVCVGTPAAFMLIGHTPPHQAEAVAHLDSVFGPAAALPAVPRLLVSLRHCSGRDDLSDQKPSACLSQADDTMTRFLRLALGGDPQFRQEMEKAQGELEANRGALARSLAAVEALLQPAATAGRRFKSDDEAPALPITTSRRGLSRS